MDRPDRQDCGPQNWCHEPHDGAERGLVDKGEFRDITLKQRAQAQIRNQTPRKGRNGSQASVITLPGIFGNKKEVDEQNYQIGCDQEDIELATLRFGGRRRLSGDIRGRRSVSRFSRVRSRSDLLSRGHSYFTNYIATGLSTEQVIRPMI